MAVHHDWGFVAVLLEATQGAAPARAFLFPMRSWTKRDEHSWIPAVSMWTAGDSIIFHRFTDPTWPNPPASCATGKPSDQWTVTQPPQESAIWPWLKQFRRFQGGTLWDAAVGMLRLALLLLKWRLVIDDVDRWRWTVLTYITIIIIIIFSSKIVHAYLSYFLLYLISFKLIK